LVNRHRRNQIALQSKPGIAAEIDGFAEEIWRFSTSAMLNFELVQDWNWIVWIVWIVWNGSAAGSQMFKS